MTDANKFSLVNVTIPMTSADAARLDREAKEKGYSSRAAYLRAELKCEPMRGRGSPTLDEQARAQAKIINTYKPHARLGEMLEWVRRRRSPVNAARAIAPYAGINGPVLEEWADEWEAAGSEPE